MILRCLPRRLGAITALSRNELCIFQGFSNVSAQGFSEPTSILVFALVKPKGQFIQIPKQMKGLGQESCSLLP
jgi:hypothetical protein